MISRRSRNGGGIRAGSFAVVMNTISDRSNGSSTNASRNWPCWAGSSTSSSTAAGSAPILSSSSSTKTGSLLPTRRSSRRIEPGWAPFHVRLWPRRSVSSRNPPQASFANPRPSASATDWASEVLPTPGETVPYCPLPGFRRDDPLPIPSAERGARGDRAPPSACWRERARHSTTGRHAGADSDLDVRAGGRRAGGEGPSAHRVDRSARPPSHC